MPELLVFTPCEKVLLDEGRNPTLIVLIENIEATIPQGAEIPSKVVAPKEWAVFTLWKSKPEEHGQQFKQICELVSPGESPKIRLESQFAFSETLHRTVMRVVGFPVGTAGVAQLQLWLEANGSAATEIVSYPIRITHKITPHDGTASTEENTKNASEAGKIH